MIELTRSGDAVFVSWLEMRLGELGIKTVVLDAHTSSAYGGALAAVAVAILLLVYGSGFENLFWAFQIGFVGSVALGLWALVVADRPWLSALLLTLSIALAQPGRSPTGWPCSS